MNVHPLGSTGLQVSQLSFGAGAIGDPTLEEHHVSAMLNAVLDAGITLIDTAPSYGLSEERIGRHLAPRRNEFLLSTKVGYGIPGIPDWTHACVEAGVRRALTRLQTEVIDIVHLHSCPAETLRANGVIDALERAREEGLVRVIAYSGENDDLAYALMTGRFQTIQTSVNICDQRGLHTYIPAAADQGVGVIAKRSLANAPWRYSARPERSDEATYWERWNALDFDAGIAAEELALRFTVFAPHVATALVGTSKAAHIARACQAIERGPLPEDVQRELRRRFAEASTTWTGLI